MTDSPESHETRASDMKAGFLGLIIGAICIFAILFTVVKITHAYYEHEQPAATQPAG